MTNFKTYDNGIRLIHKQMKETKTFSICLYVIAGSAQEKPEQAGLAHFCEHMFFKSTKNRTTKQIINDLDRIGSYSNAATSREATKFYLTTTSNFAEKSIEILTDCLINSIYLENEIESEKKVVCSEIDMYNDDNLDLAFQNSIKNFFNNNFSYAHNVIGSKETVNSFTKDSLIEFHKNFYTSGRIVISTAGENNFDEIDKYVQKYILPNFPNKETPITYKNESIVNLIKNNGEVIKKNDTEQFYFMAMSNGFSNSDRKSWLLSFASDIMGGSMSSRLYASVREEHGLVYGISTATMPLSNTGVAYLGFACNYSSAEKALQIIKEEFKKLKDYGFTQDELDLAKIQRKTHIIISDESSKNQSFLMASELVYKEKIRDIDEELNKIDNLKLEELNEFIKEYLSNFCYYITVVANKDEIDFMKILKN